MTYFKTLRVSSSYVIGNKDKRRIKSQFSEDQSRHLFVEEDNRLNKCGNKVTVISKDGNGILFSVGENIYMPTLWCIKNIPEMVSFTVYLDEGALKPILRGADVMAPGVFKYKSMVSKPYGKNDIISIRIVNGDYIAVGQATVGLEEIDDNTTGVAVRIMHRLDDALFKAKFN